MPDSPPTYRADPSADFADRLERMLLERLAAPSSLATLMFDDRSQTSARFDGVEPGDGLADDEAPIVHLDPVAIAPRSARRQRAMAAVLGGAAAALLLVSLVIRSGDDSSPVETPSTVPQPSPTTMLPPETTTPSLLTVPTAPTAIGPTVAADASAAFEGSWVLEDDGGARTMEISRAGDGYAAVVKDWPSTTCSSGAPSVATLTGRLDPVGALVLEQPTLTCDDGSAPSTAGSLEGGPANLTLTYDGTRDTLTDSADVTWRREGSAVWPQTTPDEVLDAQRRADAGDPTVAWQVDPRLDTESAAAPPDFAEIEIFARYLRDELGWEEFLSAAPAFSDRGYSVRSEDAWQEVLFIRCAAGAANDLYADDPDGASCAPSSDMENGYELVGLTVRQPIRTGPTGIWVVTDAISIWPYEQVVPPSDAEATAFLEDFLQARVDQMPIDDYLTEGTISNLYTTSDGSPYEQFEIEQIGPPAWPMGARAVTVALVAENGATVTRERFELSREPRIGEGGSLRLVPLRD